MSWIILPLECNPDYKTNRMAKYKYLSLLFFSVIAIIGYFSISTNQIDRDLRQQIADNNVTPFEDHLLQTNPRPEMVALGQTLFFDPILSGNMDIACATCHHPTTATADNIPLSIGVGGHGIGPDREIGADREFTPRNAPDIFNRNSTLWTSAFWDSRVNLAANGVIISPAGSRLPDQLDTIFAVQAMFPVTSEVEMRGTEGDVDFYGEVNDLALLDEDDEHTVTSTWDMLMDRLLALPAYETMFAEAYPDVAKEDLTFAHAAEAIAAFELDAFTFVDSPWDRYVAGDNRALTDQQKTGAALFFGEANCSQCHSGTLLTDQEHHNIGVPQYGPGRTDEFAPLDFGRYEISKAGYEKFMFRTPALRNVALTGPYMHNGVYSDLETVVRHHLDAHAGLAEYNLSELPPEFYTVFADISTDHAWPEIAVLAPEIRTAVALTDADVDALVAFLHALTSPTAEDLTYLIPDSVPSGLPFE